jgi:hypothetical protein
MSPMPAYIGCTTLQDAIFNRICRVIVYAGPEYNLISIPHITVLPFSTPVGDIGLQTLANDYVGNRPSKTLCKDKSRVLFLYDVYWLGRWVSITRAKYLEYISRIRILNNNRTIMFWELKVDWNKAFELNKMKRIKLSGNARIWYTINALYTTYVNWGYNRYYVLLINSSS